MLNNLVLWLTATTGLDVESLKLIGTGASAFASYLPVAWLFRKAAKEPAVSVWKWATTKKPVPPPPPPPPPLPLCDLAVLVLDALRCAGWEYVEGYRSITNGNITVDACSNWNPDSLKVNGRIVTHTLAGHEMDQIRKAAINRREQIDRDQAEADRLAAVDALTAPKAAKAPPQQQLSYNGVTFTGAVTDREADVNSRTTCARCGRTLHRNATCSCGGKGV